MPMTKGRGSDVGPMAERIERQLRVAFDPETLDVINESHLHAGHAGDDGTGESHFRVRLRSSSFSGQSRVAIHRAVNVALAEELRTVHALAIDARATPSVDATDTP